MSHRRHWYHSVLRRIDAFFNPPFSKDYQTLPMEEGQSEWYTEDGYHRYYDRRFLRKRDSNNGNR